MNLEVCTRVHRIQWHIVFHTSSSHFGGHSKSKHCCPISSTGYPMHESGSLHPCSSYPVAHCFSYREHFLGQTDREGHNLPSFPLGRAKQVSLSLQPGAEGSS